MRIKYEDMMNEFKRILEKKGFSESDAIEAAKIFTDNSVDGVYSHGVNRFPRVIRYLKEGYIKPKAKPEKIMGIGSFEQWDGNLAMGNLTAKKAMDRAIKISKENGIGIVAVRNTNHWMRGGSYGLQAAKEGCVGICWTNTIPNMPAWGGKDSKIGNNPFVIGIPRENGNHVLIDCAMAQFSYGAIEKYRLEGKELPVPGGYDSDGNITTNPEEIEKTWRVLPIGHWKGSGLSIAFDLAATILSGGNSTTVIGRDIGDEYAVSQVFISIDPSYVISEKTTEDLIDEVITDIKKSKPMKEGVDVLYPGEPEAIIRQENLTKGIPVVKEIWEDICSM